MPAGKPAKLAVAVDALMVKPLGEAVTVHGATGNPLKATVAVAVAQVGCVITPTTGAVGNALTVTVGVTLICVVQPVAVSVAKTLKVVFTAKLPVGKLIVPPVPVTATPIDESSASFLS